MFDHISQAEQKPELIGNTDRTQHHEIKGDSLHQMVPQDRLSILESTISRMQVHFTLEGVPPLTTTHTTTMYSNAKNNTDQYQGIINIQVHCTTTYRLIIPDCINLSEKHDCCEYGKKQTLEDEEEKKDNCGWRGEGGTLPPLIFDTDDELVDAEE